MERGIVNCQLPIANGGLPAAQNDLSDCGAQPHQIQFSFFSFHFSICNSPRRRGFTLVEMLVVIAILGILMGMLLPAVNFAREAMRRFQCKNNLKQIGAAAQQHLTQYGFFPSSGWGSAWVGDPDLGVGTRQPGGWIYNILPFTSLNMIHDKGKGLASGPKGTAMAEAMSAPIPFLICPTRRRAVAYPGSGSSNNGPSSYPALLNKTDYAANGGSNVITGAGPPATCLTTYPNCNWSNPNQSNFNGISGERSQVRAADVTNGLGNCLFAGEKSLDPAYYYSGANGVENFSALQGNDYETNRWVANKPTQDAYGQLTTNCTIFGSAHPAGFNVVFCDGSAKLLNWGTSTNVLATVAVRNYLTLNPGTSFETF